MANCSHTYKGVKSNLYDQLWNLYHDDSIAHTAWENVRSLEFLQQHGDWENGAGNIPLDSNGEPEVDWVRKTLNLPEPKLKPVTAIQDPKLFTNHSGGAAGSDSAWDSIGRQLGFTNHNHYWHGKQTPTGNVQITDEQLEEGWRHVLEANKSLKRAPAKYKSLLSRNWFQVKNSDGVYAIGKLAGPAEVSGGTGWAVQMAIDSKKPVYLFDQEQKDWYSFDYATHKFKKYIGTPVLTQNFAGIGTRELENIGRQAIREVYEKTIAQGALVPASSGVSQTTVQTIITRNFEPDKKERNRNAATRDPEEAVLNSIRGLYEEAKANPNNTYQLDYENNQGKFRYRSGYYPAEMAALLDSMDIPKNVQFTESMQKLVYNSPRRIREAFDKGHVPELMGRNEEHIRLDAANFLMPKLSEDGKTIEGYFTPKEQEDMSGSLVKLVQIALQKDPDMGANAIIRSVRYLHAQATNEKSPATEEERRNLLYAYRQRTALTESALRQLEGLGLRVDSQSRAKILQAVNLIQPMSELDKKLVYMEHPELNPDIHNEDTGEFIEASSRGLKDWNDVSFELDPRDTASANIKMFIATLPRLDKAVYTPGTAGKAAILLPVTTNVTDPQSLKILAQKLNRKSFFYRDEQSTQQLAQRLSEVHPFVPEVNLLGIPQIADFNSTFQKVLETLASVPQNLQAYYAALEQSSLPVLQTLSTELKALDEGAQNEFATVMSKQYQQFTMMLFNRTSTPEGAESWTLNPISSNRYAQQDSIIRQWQEQQKLSDLMITDKTNQRIIDIDRVRTKWIGTDEKPGILKTIQNDLAAGKSMIEYDEKGKFKSMTPFGQSVKKYMTDILHVSGVDMNTEMMDYLFRNIDRLSPFRGDLASQFSVNKTDNKPNGLFSAFIMRAAGAEVSDDLSEDSDVLSERATSFNPLYNKTLMKPLATVAARFTPVLYSNSHKDIEGKNRWDYGLHSKLSHSFRSFSQQFDEFRKVQESKLISRDNWLMNIIANNPEHLKYMQLSYLDGIKPTWGKKGTVRTSMSDREHLLMSLSLFQNRGHGFDNKLPKVSYLSLTHSDKTTTPVFSNMPRIIAGSFADGYSAFLGTTKSPMYKVFRNEWERITNGQKTQYNDKKYEDGKNLFYFLPQFNYDAMKDMVDREELTKDEFETLWVGGQRKLAPVVNSDRELPVINKILERIARTQMKEVTDRWQQEGIVNMKENKALFDKDYVQKILEAEGLRKGKKSGDEARPWLDAQEQVVPAARVHQILVVQAAKDYALNHFLFDIATSQLFYGDPALTYKGKPGTHDLQQVDATMKDYAKRLAKDIAPGQDPYWRGKQSYNTITLADVKTSENYLPEKLLSAYGKNNKGEGKVEGTDAQEVTTVQEHLDVMYALGKINRKVYEDMTRIIAGAGKGGYYEFTVPEHLAVILQPAKPVYSGSRTVDPTGVQFEDYVKSSSYPLYPPMVTGTAYEGLRVHMEQNNIQRANFESAKKIGAPVSPAALITPDGSFSTSGVNWQSAVQTLDRSGFRIQQEVPYDEEKEAIKIVSQMNKLIVQGTGDLEGFDVGGKIMNGKQLRQYKEAIRKQMVHAGRNDFLQKFGIDPMEYDKGNITIQQVSKIYDMLAEEGHKKGYTANEQQGLTIRDAAGQPLLPLVLNTAADRIESLLMSLNKKITEIKMPGKSFVQASGVGYTFTSEDKLDKSGVVWLGSHDGTALKTIRKENGKITPAQVLLPFNFSDKEGNKLNVMDFARKENGRWIIDEDKLPAPLRQLVGARIPNQGHNSMLPIEVVGFIPANMGDLVIVPAAITNQMGADFDVDKLYTYKRPYTFDGEKFHTIPEKDRTEHKLDYLRKIYPNSSDTDLFDYEPSEEEQQFIDKDYLENGQSKEYLQNEYFNTHWAVLNHEAMLEKILQPLDKPDLEDENKLLQARMTKNPWSNYFGVLNQLDDFQSGKEAKTLVGSTSLAVTFNAVIQDKNLHLIKWATEEDENGKPRKVKVPDYIEVKKGDSTLKLGRLSGNGTSLYKADKDNPVRTKHDNHTTVQSAAVDNAKNRTMDNLSITTNTYPAVQAFTQLENESGEAVDLTYVTRLLAQPAIREFDAMMKKGNDSLSEKFTPDLKNTVLFNLRQKYILQVNPDGFTDEEMAKLDAIRFDPELLDKSMSMEGKDFAMHQLAALSLFGKLHDIGTRLRELQSLFNQDTNGAGPNILTALDKWNKLNNLSTGIIGGEEDIFGLNEADRTEQGSTFLDTIGTARNVLTQLLPYDKLEETFRDITKLTLKPSLSIDRQRSIIRSIRSFIYTQGQYWWQDSGEDRARLLYGTSGEKSLAQRLLDARRAWGKDNYFLQRLNPKFAELTGGPEYVEYQAAQVGRIDEDNNVRAWMSLLMSDNQEHRKMGEDLLRYAFLTGGVQDANSFVKFAPVAYLVNTSFGSMLNEIGYQMTSQDIPFTQPGFIQQYFQHNPDLAPQVSTEQLRSLEPSTSGDYPELFRIPSPDDPLYASSGLRSYETAVGQETKLADFLSYRSSTEGKWILYRNIGSHYQRIDTLGNQWTDEYNGESNSAVRSLFSDNRALLNNGYADSQQAISTLTNASYGEIYEGTTPYNQINVREGGQEAIDGALNNIADNTSLPQSARTVAKFLAGADIPVELKTALEALQLDYSPRIVFSESLRSAGNADSLGTIRLNPSGTKSAAGATAVFLHELIHTRLQNIIIAGGYDPRVPTGWITPELEAWKAAHPEVVQHLAALEQVRKEYLQHLTDRMGENKVKGIQNKFGQSTLTPEEVRVYAASSLQEFVTHVMTHAGVQQELNSLTSGRTESLLSRIWSVLADLLTAIGKSLGITIRDNSLLKEALVHTMAMTDMEQVRRMDLAHSLTSGVPMLVSTEKEAVALRNIVQRSYGRQASLTNTGSNWMIGVSNASWVDDAQATSKVQRMAGKLKQQLHKAYDNINKATTTKERVEARNHYNELRESLQEMQREDKLEYITRNGQQQLKWVDSILAQDNPSPSDVFTAIDTVNIWTGLIGTLYSDAEGLTGIPEDFARIQEKAQVQRIRLMNSQARKTTADLLNGWKVTLTQEDFGKNLVDLSKPESLFRTAYTAKQMITQAIGAAGYQQANNRNEDISRVADSLKEMKARMEKNRLTPDAFLHKDSWTLIDRLSPQWYGFKRDLQSSRDKELEAIETSTGSTEESRRDQKGEVWRNYWDSIRANAAFVDTRVFFDWKTGEKMGEDKTAAALEKLSKAVGSEQYARELIDQAHSLFKDYVEERTLYHDKLVTETELSEAEKQGKTSDQIQQETDARIQQQLDGWIQRNSPTEFLNRMSPNSKVKYMNNGDRWIVMAPTITANKGEYYDQQWHELHKTKDNGEYVNKEAQQLYADYRSLVQRLVSYLPAGARETLSPDFLPIVSADTVNSLATTIGKIRNWDTTLLNMITGTEAEEFARLKPDEIPTLYTRKPASMKDKLDEDGNVIQKAKVQQSTDPFRVLEVFSMMALHYHYMAPVLDKIRVAQQILQDINRQRINEEVDGKPLTNTLATVKYFMDSLIFNKPRELEGKVSKPIYSIAKQRDIEKKVADLVQKAKQLNEDSAAAFESGDYTKSAELDEQIKKINQELEDYKGMERHIYGSKVADTLITYNMVRSIGYDPVSAVGNLTFGLISLSVHANGKVDFGHKHVWKAYSIATNAMKKYYTAGVADNPTARKIMHLMHRSGVMTEIANTQLEGSNLALNSPSNMFSPFNWQRSGDYFAKASMMIAMMLKHEVAVTHNGQTAKVSLWDAMDEDGKWNEAKYGKNPQWYSDTITDQQDWNNFRDRMRRVAMIVFGNQDRNAPMLAKKSLLWRIAGQFRMSWLPEGIATRWASERDDTLLGRKTKGRWRTYGDLGIVQSGVILAKQLLSALPGVQLNPFDGHGYVKDHQRHELISPEGIESVDVENMRKNLAGLMWTIAMGIVIMSLKALAPDEKGKKKDDAAMREMLLLNLLIRNYQDLSLYASPDVFNQVSGNFFPAAQVVTDSMKALYATGHYITHPNDKKEFDKWFNKVSRTAPGLRIIPKMKFMLTRPLDSISK